MSIIRGIKLQDGNTYDLPSKIQDMDDWAATTDVTISSVTYKTFWKVAPTLSNQVYGISIHPTSGKLYRIYNDRGAYSAFPYISYVSINKDREFVFDTSCGDASISDDGTAVIAEIRGNTIVENGELVSYKGTKIKSVGFNAYHNGTAELLGGKQYQITGSYTALSYSTGETITPDGNGLFTPAGNGVLTVTGGDDTTCVHLTWSGYRNGEYEPYWEQEIDLPTLTYFPDGMKSAGAVYDSILQNKTIKRIRKVDLGTLHWYSEPGGEGYNNRFTTLLSDVIPTPGWHVADVVCALFMSSVVYHPTKTVIGLSGSYLYASGEEYKDMTTTQFQAAMNGVMAYYVLADPVETPIDPPLNLRYKVADFGTEESVSTDPSTPFKGVIKYSTVPDVSGKEDKYNKVSSWSESPNNEHYPSEKLVKDSIDTATQNISMKEDRGCLTIDGSQYQLVVKDLVITDGDTTTTYKIVTLGEETSGEGVPLARGGEF